jgi:hypothetical protein
MTLDAVTPAWLTRILRRRAPDVAVTDVELDQIRHRRATTARVHLTFADPTKAAGLPDTMFVKGAFRAELRPRTWKGLQNEAQFFGTVARELPLNLPATYFAETDPESHQSVLLLEDLICRRARFGRFTEPLDADSVAVTLTELARLHAARWGSRRLAWHGRFRASQQAYVTHLLRPSHWLSCMDTPQATWMPSELRDPGLVRRALERLWAIWDSSAHCLVHGHLHVGNTFREGDGRSGLLDWECVMASHWSHDVPFLIISALDVNDRRVHEEDLLASYLQALEEAGAPAPSYASAWLSYRQASILGLAVSAASPADTHPDADIRAGSERFAAAAADHDPLAALGLR